LALRALGREKLRIDAPGDILTILVSY
jgi:hypothetical protein